MLQQGQCSSYMSQGRKLIQARRSQRQGQPLKAGENRNVPWASRQRAEGSISFTHYTVEKALEDELPCVAFEAS